MRDKLPLSRMVRGGELYEMTGTDRDSHGTEVVIITCQACGYFEEHFTGRGLSKVGRRCDRCGR